MTRDDTDRMNDGDLPVDPFDGTTPMEPTPEDREALQRKLDAARLEVEGLEQALTVEPASEGEPGVWGATWRTVAEWSQQDGADWLDLAKDPPDREWLLKRPDGDDSKALFPLGKVGMLAAAGGVGKTMALCELALAVAAGRPWLDVLTVATPGRVLLALGEEDAAEARRRLWRAAERLNKAAEFNPGWTREVADNIVVLPLAGTPGMALTQDEQGGQVETPAAGALRRLLQADGQPWRLIILDPASRFAGAEMEKDNAAATRFVQVLETLTQVPGTPSVLVAHHTSQAARKESGADASGARGVTGFSDAVRWQAELKTRKAYDGAPALVDFKMTKNNYAAPWEGFALARDPDGGALRLAADADLDKYAAAKVVGQAKAAAQKERDNAAELAGVKAAKDGGSDAEIAAAVDAKMTGKGTDDKRGQQGKTHGL